LYAFDYFSLFLNFIFMLFFSRSSYLNSENKVEVFFGMIPYWYKYAFVNLFSSVGAHIGHSFKNTLRESA